MWRNGLPSVLGSQLVKTAVVMVVTDVARKIVDTVAVLRIMAEENMVETKAEDMEAKGTVVAIQT